MTTVNREARSIDEAMLSDRPAKQTVRSLWVAQARADLTTARKEDVPLYLTLPGAAGLDLRALLDSRVIRQNESGGISDEDVNLLVAFESNMLAVGQLKREFPNLRVKEVRVEEFMAGVNPDSYPAGDAKKLMRAKIINLDFNGRLSFNGNGTCPQFVMVDKFAHVHTATKDRTAIDWTLCITVNAAGLDGPPEHIRALLQNFVADQASVSPNLHTCVSQIAPYLLTDDYDLTAEIDQTKIQRALSIALPLQIAHRLAPHGWRVEPQHLLSYGHDGDSTASMVSVILGVQADEAMLGAPQHELSQSHAMLGSASKIVHKDGMLSPLDGAADPH